MDQAKLEDKVVSLNVRKHGKEPDLDSDDILCFASLLAQHSEIMKKASIKTCQVNQREMYGEIYNMVTSEKGGYSDLSFMVHSPDQVRTLISS